MYSSGVLGEMTHTLLSVSKCSPLLERHWLRLQRNLDNTIHPTRQYTWKLSSSEVDGGAIKTVFERVSNPLEDGEWLKPIDVKNLSRYCGALWHLNIVPRRLPSHEQWEGHASIRSPDIINDGTPLSTPTASEEGIAGKLHISLAAARAALVLGQEARFKYEIKLFLSMLPGGYREERPAVATIKLLRVEHLEGMCSAPTQHKATRLMQHRHKIQGAGSHTGQNQASYCRGQSGQ